MFLLLAGSAALAVAALFRLGGWLYFGPTPGSATWLAAAAGGAAFLLIGIRAAHGVRSIARDPQALIRSLGAAPLAEREPLHDGLRRVAEETAIAAGVPVPMLFVLPLASINALTLGESPSAAALIVTSGALEQLDEEELRGLVAHELAHVFRGDIAANTKLAGLLLGFLWPALPFGTPWVRLAWRLVHTRHDCLADATAVRFTGDRDGLGRVLRRITGATGQPLAGIHASRVEHCLFIPSRRRCSAAGIDAHVDERIRRLYGRSMPGIPSTGSGAAAASKRARPRPAGPEGAAPCPQETHSRQATAPTAGARDPSGAEQRATPASVFRDEAADRRSGAVPGDAAAGVSCSRSPDAVPDCGALAYRETAPRAAEYPVPAGELSWFSSQMAVDCGSSDVRAARQLEELVGYSRSAHFDDETAGRWLGLLTAGVPYTAGRDRAGRAGGPEQAKSAGNPLDCALDWILSSHGAPWRMPLFELLLARTRGWNSTRRRALLEQCRRAVVARARDHPGAWVYYMLAQHRLSLPGGNDARMRRTLVSRFDQSRALAILFAMAAKLGEASARNTRDALADAAMLLTISPPAATPDRVTALDLLRSLEILSALPAFSKPILLKVLGRLARAPQEPVYQAFLRAVAAAIDCPGPRIARHRVPRAPAAAAGVQPESGRTPPAQPRRTERSSA